MMPNYAMQRTARVVTPLDAQELKGATPAQPALAEGGANVSAIVGVDSLMEAVASTAPP